MASLALSALSQCSHRVLRSFCTSAPCLSNIGRKAIPFDPSTTELLFHNPYPIPQDKFPPSKHAIDSRKPYILTVKGPLGKLERQIPPFVRIGLSQSSVKNNIPQATLQQQISISIDFPQSTKQRALWGTFRAHIANMIHGVNKGWSSTLKLVGVGFRASMNNDAVHLKLGYANTIVLPVPDGLTVKTPTPDVIEIFGANRDTVSQFAATIRSYKPPEPFNQKGIFVDAETITKKKGKKR